MSKINKELKKVRSKKKIEELVGVGIKNSTFGAFAKLLASQIDKRNFEKKYAPVKEVLKLVGAGAFLAASLAVPNLPKALKPLLISDQDYEVWKRFNIPYLKRTLRRLEAQKWVEISEENKQQVVSITETGKRRILKYALEEMTIEKPKIWDRKWRLVSYDIPLKLKSIGETFRCYLDLWNFYPLHESVCLHAYPCEKQIVFLREYLGIGEYVKLFLVDKIENDQHFRNFFAV